MLPMSSLDLSTHSQSSATARANTRTGASGSQLVRVQALDMLRGDRRVLKNVSLSFEAGTVTALVGRSGVGKTTLLGALNGLLVPTQGSITMASVGELDNATALRKARRQIGTVFQEHALIGRLTALDNVLLGLADLRHPLSPLPWPRVLRERAASVLDDVGLLSRAHARVCELSGGEQQRVGIARALVRKPRLLLGDEPFASVDAALARALAGELRNVVLRTGLTVILVLHQLAIARSFADRIVGLTGGAVTFDGPAAEFDAAAEALVFN
jgi:phosphonate transport system ATP-binding protein